MTTTWTPQAHSAEPTLRRRATTLAPVVGLVLSAGLFVAVLTSGGKSVATAETVAPASQMVARADQAAISQDLTESVDRVEAGSLPGATTSAPAREAASQSPSRRASAGVAGRPQTSARRPIRATAPPAAQPAAATPAVTTPLSVSLAFEPSRALQFANWAGNGASVTTAMATRMFGASAVCASGAQADCVPKASAARLIDDFNAQLASGRCEGMVAMVGLALEAGRDLSGLDRGRADDEIAYWSFSQVAPRVAARAEATRATAPSKIVDAIASRLSERRTVSLLMWGEGTAHAVLPVAVSRAGSVAEIAVWDPNFPNRLSTVVVVTDTETWTYTDAVDATGAQAGLRSTGSGNLGFVENDLRTGEHRARFSD